MGLISAFVATYANTETSAPIYICAVLYIVMVSNVPPFEMPMTGRLTCVLYRLSLPSSCRLSPMERGRCKNRPRILTASGIRVPYIWAALLAAMIND